MFQIVCAQDYKNQDTNIVGIDPIAVGNFSACVDLCRNQGTVCAGVTYGTFGGSSTECYLKKKIYPSTNPGYEVDSALRLSGPTGLSSRTQLITNGGFDGGTLSPWTSGTDSENQGFTVVNGAAYVALSFPRLS